MSTSIMAYQTIQQEYMQMPPITRAYTTACVLTTVAVVSIHVVKVIVKIQDDPSLLISVTAR